MMSNERKSAFADLDDDVAPTPAARPNLDVSGFKPEKRTAADLDTIRTTAEGRGFVSRAPKPQEPVTMPTGGQGAGVASATTLKTHKKPRRHVTGRNQQLNIKVTAEAYELFYKISDEKGWVLGETLENALAALVETFDSEKQ